MKYLQLILLFLPVFAFGQNEINKPLTPTYFVAFDSTSNIYHIGTTEPNQVTTSGQPDFIFSTDALDFLSQTNNIPISYDTLPPTGEQVVQGEIYEYQGSLVICRQTHIRTIFEPAETPALFAVYRSETPDAVLPWIIGEIVYVGYIRSYNDVNYECIQQHQTVIGQTPDLVSALWNVIATGDDWQVGVSYSVGDIVNYEGSQYECIQSHISISGWQPPNVPALWGLI